MKDHNSPEYTLIENDTDLRELPVLLEKEPAIGVDLEADSMFHYQEKVCLIQISTRTLNLIVDPLSVKDLSALAPVFAHRGIRKIFHGSDYDMRSLYRDFRIEVHSLFDTQIAARFLGMRETGLASLLYNQFQVSSDKRYQKKDWSKRPLPEPMLQYGVQDTCHLIPLAEILEKELMEKGRLFCVEEECELLSMVRPNSAGNGSLFSTFKGAAGLDQRSLAVLEKILHLRDRLARQRDCPHFKVLGNRPIMEIAQMKPLTLADLARVKELSSKTIDRMGQSIIKGVREGMDLPESMLPLFPKKPWHRLKPKEARRVKRLKIWRDRLGEEWGVDPSVISTNAQIEAIAVANPGRPQEMAGIKGIRRWQVRLFGHDICALLREAG
ncbi:MAG: HRDC domain-containing protein [Deltaproteobacteria bacterium]|nr:HRDC domain-containing protein [Deltaproteobacteria bacterium]